MTRGQAMGMVEATDAPLLRRALRAGSARAVAEVVRRAPNPRHAALAMSWAADRMRRGSTGVDIIERGVRHGLEHAAGASDPDGRRVGSGPQNRAGVSTIEVLARTVSQGQLFGLEDVLDNWRATDPHSLLDFTVVELMYGISEPVLEHLDRPPSRSLLERALDLVPVIGVRAARLLVDWRPGLVAGSLGRTLGVSGSEAHHRLPLAGALAQGAPEEPIDATGRTARSELYRIARGRTLSGAKPGSRAGARRRLVAAQELARVGEKAAADLVHDVILDHRPSGMPAEWLEAMSHGGLVTETDPGSSEQPAVRERIAIGVARHAVSVLGRIGDAASIEHLGRIAARYPIDRVREDASRRLVRLAGPPRDSGRLVGRGSHYGHRSGRPTASGEACRAALRTACRDVLTGTGSESAVTLADTILGRDAVSTIAADQLADIPRPARAELAVRATISGGPAHVERLVRAAIDAGDVEAAIRIIVAADLPVERRGDGPAAESLASEVSRSIETQARHLALRIPGEAEGEDVPVGDTWTSGFGNAARHLVMEAVRRAVRPATMHGWLSERTEAERATIVPALILLAGGLESLDGHVDQLMKQAVEASLVEPPVGLALAERRIDRPGAPERWVQCARAADEGTMSRGLPVAAYRLLSRLSALDQLPPPPVYAEICAMAIHWSSTARQHIIDILLPAKTSDPAYDARIRAVLDGHGPLHDVLIAACQSTLDWIRGEAEAVLEEPVAVKRCRVGMGRTAFRRGADEIVLEVGVDPILDGWSRGVEAVKGVGLHEMGHQLYDYREPGLQYEHRRLERLGLRDLHNLILDERLERRLRSRDAAYGRAIDAAIQSVLARRSELVDLAAIAALSGRDVDELRESFRTGVIPGRLRRRVAEGGEPEDAVLVKAGELARVPGLATPEQAFMWALRTGADPRDIPCPQARAALREVPRDLRRANLAQVSGIVIRVSDALGGAEAERDRRRRHRQLADKFEQIASALRAWRRLMDQLAGPSGMDRMDDADAEGKSGGIPISSGGSGSSDESPKGPPVPRPIHWRPAAGDTPRFRKIKNVVKVPFNGPAHVRLRAEVKGDVRVVRRAIERLGTRIDERRATVRGGRLDAIRAPRAAFMRDPRVLIDRHEQPSADVCVGLLVDRSGSMCGEKIELARRFGCLVTEATAGIRGVEGIIGAFDDKRYHDLGTFARPAISELEADDGNNDAAGLTIMGERVARSRRRHKVIIMVSDGSPTECTVAAFHGVAESLEQAGIRIIHMLIDHVDSSAALPNRVDLSESSEEESTKAFAEMLPQVLLGGGRSKPAGGDRGRGRGEQERREEHELSVRERVRCKRARAAPMRAGSTMISSTGTR